jgi:hypothetical protein
MSKGERNNNDMEMERNNIGMEKWGTMVTGGA